MAGRGPMLINLPPPPSDPVTPNEHGPGTPNSTTTSLSALSVVANKDGAAGSGGRGATSSANTLEAERADRISRLAGLERVSTVRGNHPNQVTMGQGAQIDHNVPIMKERSTVGSASATGSVGGRTTWASESFDNDGDKMSEDQDDDYSNTEGLSDEDKASLVGFGEGANSTVSGPVSTANARMIAARQNFVHPSTSRTSFAPTNSGQSTPMSGVVPTSTTGSNDPKTMDGFSHDAMMVDSNAQTPPSTQRFQGVGTEMAETIMRDRLHDSEPGRKGLGTPDSQGLGKFSFERDSR